MATIGSARIDEHGKATGGQRGDQKQTTYPDYKGEVSRQDFYVSSKGWIILRPKNQEHAKKIADAMGAACDNKNIGYAQNDRYSILSIGTGTKTPANCDCSSLVRECVKEGTGKDPGDFTTANEPTKLMATGLFNRLEYVKGMDLLTGDVLVTKTKGHTVIVIEGDRKKTVQEIAKEVISGKWGSGIDRKNRLHAAGYDYAIVQAEVNRILSASTKTEKPAEHIGLKGQELIKFYEKCRLRPYQIPGEKYLTIGWGHHGPDVTADMKLTQAQADQLLRDDLVEFEKYVKKYVTDIVLTQNRFDALVSYTYNRGPKGLKQLADHCHTVQEYADGMVTYWGSAERYKTALVNRRKKERELFLS